MLRINCPCCGTRDEEEFTYGGAWDKPRPVDPAALSDTQWADYLFGKSNARGHTWEKWRHTNGCRQWFAVERHTVTHAIVRVAALEDVARRVAAISPPAQLPQEAIA